MHPSIRRPRLALASLVAASLLCASAAAAFTVTAVEPFHLAPDDYFEVTLAGIAPPSVASVTVRLDPAGPEAAVGATVLRVDGGTVGARLPATIPVGSYTVEVLVSGTANEGTDPPVWVRERELSFRKRKQIEYVFPHKPPGVNFKEADFGDLDGDGDFDVFAANSRSNEDVDRLYFSQLGVDEPDCPTADVPEPPDSPGSPPGPPPGERFYCEDIGNRMVKDPDFAATPGAGDSDLRYHRTYDADFLDVDLDGDLDLVRTDRNSAAPLRVFLNDGGGTLIERTKAWAGPSGALSGVLPSLADIGAEVGDWTAEMQTGDVNNDGTPDILLCSWKGGASRRLALLLNRIPTTGSFELLDPNCDGPGTANGLCQTGTPNNRGCGLGDFDNDGWLDVLAPSIQTGLGHKVLINTLTAGDEGGVPDFTPHDDWIRTAAVGGEPIVSVAGDVKVADLDGDGDDDVAISSPPNDAAGAPLQSLVLWNAGGNALVLAGGDWSVGDAYDVAFSDLDRDGDLDVVFARQSAANHVLINHGGTDQDLLLKEYPLADLWFEEGPFGDVDLPGTSDFTLSASLADYDRDGDEDILGAGFSDMALWESRLFDPGNDERDWVFILDRTASMTSLARDFFEPAKNVIVTYLGQRSPGDEVGLVSFDYSGAVNSPDPPDDANKARVEFTVGELGAAALIAEVEAMPLGTCIFPSCTSIGQGLRVGLDTALTDTDPGREKVLVLVTDGANNMLPAPAEVVPDLPSHVSLHAIALGFGTDDEVLAELASNGGKFYVAGRSDDYASVQSALRDINVDLEASETGSQPLTPITLATIRRIYGFEQLPEIGGPANLLSVIVDGKAEYFTVDPGDRQVRFTMSWKEPSPETSLRLVDPKGRIYPDEGGDLVRQRRGDKFHVIEVLDPLSGFWRVAPRIDGTTGPIKTTGLAVGSLALSAAPDFPIYYPGERLRIGVDLVERGAPVPVLEVAASFLSPSEQTIEVQGVETRPGRWELVLPALAETGTWRARVVALGTATRPFVRKWETAIHVKPDVARDPDLRSAEIELGPGDFTAGGGQVRTATATLKRRDGQPLVGATVSFQARGAVTSGPVTDHGDGTYSQDLTPGETGGGGWVKPRVGRVLLAAEVRFEVGPADVDPDRSTLDVLVGLGALCPAERGEVPVELRPRDQLGNPMPGSTVEIEQLSGPGVDWLGPAASADGGRSFVRRFASPRRPGRYVFGARVDGVAVAAQTELEIFDPDSEAGRDAGCEPLPPSLSPGCLLLLVLLLLIVLVLAVRKWRSS
jgi:hypothetical protein